MIQIYLLLALVIVVFFVLRGFFQRTSSASTKNLRLLGLSAITVAVLLLIATGRLNWLLGAIGLGLAYLLRLIPVLLGYAPQLHKIWEDYKAARGGSAKPQDYAGGGHGKMSVEEAYQVLGLKSGASEQEVIAAHRKLIQKIHPDRGGSDYLAMKINLAKKTLINK
ncbi:MAG: DnaJ domain-containing protein [Methylovulum sp.]|nr:DnaJ domain-containing protein [Methylovulum sp.]